MLDTISGHILIYLDSFYYSNVLLVPKFYLQRFCHCGLHLPSGPKLWRQGLLELRLNSITLLPKWRSSMISIWKRRFSQRLNSYFFLIGRRKAFSIHGKIITNLKPKYSKIQIEIPVCLLVNWCNFLTLVKIYISAVLKQVWKNVPSPIFAGPHSNRLSSYQKIL